MPELPEVETVRRELQSQLLGKKLQALNILNPQVWKSSASKANQLLVGKQLQSIERKGKLLVFRFDAKLDLLAHLKMTGQFLCQREGQVQAGIYPLLSNTTPDGTRLAGSFQAQQHLSVDDKHTHTHFVFDDDLVLSFRDVRKFGYLRIVTRSKSEDRLKRFGIDPLDADFTVGNFRQIFEGRKKSVKAVLMDQELVAGIGNIYADEICHQVGIRPHRSVKTLSETSIEALFQSTLDILHRAVEHKGTTLRDYTRPGGGQGKFAFELKAYGREGLPCLRCDKGTIVKERYLGRGTHYCSDCSK